MRRLFLALMVSLTPGPVFAQAFTSPLDVVSTLYGTYFLNVPLSDIRPYFSDKLTEQLGGALVGREQFKAAGIDPLTGRLDWQPRGFDLSVLGQASDTAKVQARFQDGVATTAVTFDLIREKPHGWQIDHIAGTSGDRSWCTNAIVSMTQQ